MSKRISKDRKRRPLVRNKRDSIDYVSAEVALKPMTTNYKILEGNEWVVSSNVKNYVPSKENIGATVKGLSDVGFHVLGIGTASILSKSVSTGSCKFFALICVGGSIAF